MNFSTQELINFIESCEFKCRLGTLEECLQWQELKAKLQRPAPIEFGLHHGQTSNYADVANFHSKFGLLVGSHPRKLTKRKLIERIQFMQEELDEFINAAGCYLYDDGVEPFFTEDYIEEQSFADQVDALIDLVYVAMGTAVMMGIPWQPFWDDVQRANMSKERGMTKRGHPVDVTKPEGWVGPKTNELLNLFGYNETLPETDDPEI